MNVISTRLNAAIWTAAAVLLVAGIFSMGRAALDRSARLNSVRRSQTQIAELQDLEWSAAVALLPLEAWRKTGHEPVYWRAILRELGLNDAVNLRNERTVSTDLPGWSLRSAELQANALTPVDLRRLVDHAQALPHPWRLRGASIKANQGEPMTLNASLRFETAVAIE